MILIYELMIRIILDFIKREDDKIFLSAWRSQNERGAMDRYPSYK